jgi:hypothetical protein
MTTVELCECREALQLRLNKHPPASLYLLTTKLINNYLAQSLSQYLKSIESVWRFGHLVLTIPHALYLLKRLQIKSPESAINN